MDGFAKLGVVNHNKNEVAQCGFQNLSAYMHSELLVKREQYHLCGFLRLWCCAVAATGFCSVFREQEKVNRAGPIQPLYAA